MELIERLLADLPEDAQTFKNQHPHDVLVRRPISLFQEDDTEADGDFEYRTVAVKPDDDGIPAWKWFIAPLIKRVGNPFPEHLSVGRAPNCDIVMRLPYVSKSHARFYLIDGRVSTLEDLGSSNGTGVNGRQLAQGQKVEVKGGDRLSFGSLVVTLMTPEEFYGVLRYRRKSSQSPPRSSVG